MISERANKVIALEIDSRMLPILGRIKGVEVVHQDIREFDLSGLSTGYRVVANLPYYMTSFVIRKLLESSNPSSDILILIQREVAQRIVAPIGDKSVLAIMVEYWADSEVLLDIAPEKFSPPPRVHSSLIRIRPIKKRIQDLDYQDLMKLVRAGFLQKRKKLKNSLSVGLGQPVETIELWLERAKIDGNKRAQQLDIEDWGRLLRYQKENTP